MAFQEPSYRGRMIGVGHTKKGQNQSNNQLKKLKHKKPVPHLPVQMITRQFRMMYCTLLRAIARNRTQNNFCQAARVKDLAAKKH